MVLGMCDILQDRAAFKDEFRVERTQLSIGRNNPLKHLPAIEVAKVLLGKPLPGFMDMEESLRTSLEDLKKHQLAMLAGVQNALLVVFDRLAPAEIERFAGKVENQKRGLLGRREPDRWAVYMTVFEALRRDATGNANGVMSVAFREGYETFMKSVR
jgi:type VI secretion system FHA domain protein